MTTYTNLFPNSRPGATGGGWTVSNGPGGTAAGTLLTTAGGPAGDNARRVTWSVSPTGFNSGSVAGTASGIAPGTAGTLYSTTAWVRFSRSQVIFQRLNFYSETAYTTSLGQFDSAPMSLAANTWTEIKVEGKLAPTGTAAVRLEVRGHTTGSLFLAGDTLDVQAATIVQAATVPQPFHGGMASDALRSYAWTGTADASASTMDIVYGPPTDLTVTPVSSTEADLAWTPDPGVTFHVVERDGVIIASNVTGGSYVDTTLTLNTTYSYRVGSSG